MQDLFLLCIYLRIPFYPHSSLFPLCVITTLMCLVYVLLFAHFLGLYAYIFRLHKYILSRVHFVSFFLLQYHDLGSYWCCCGYIWNAVSRCVPHILLPWLISSLGDEAPTQSPTPCHNTQRWDENLYTHLFPQLFDTISRCWLGLPFDNPRINWCLTGPDWPWWGPDLSWAVFIFGELWFWLPDTLGKQSFVLPSFCSSHRLCG